MQIDNTSKSASRITRSTPITEALPRAEIQRLERFFGNGPAFKNANWNLKCADIDVVNGQSLLNIRAMHMNKVREKTAVIDERIIINVCGDRYETHRTTLELFPDTLLGNAKRRKYYYDPKRKEYFFDRHRACFEAILYYYQSNGRLRRPQFVSTDIFLEEVTFFQLGQEALNQLRKDENIKEVKKIRLPKNHIRRFIWATIEYPAYSLLAKIVNIISLILILISTIALAVQSLPQYASSDDLNCQQILNTTNTTTDSDTNLYRCYVYFQSPFFIIQTVCVGFFTIELILRILTTPSLCDYVKNIMNWIDLLAVVPYYISLGFDLSDRDEINVHSNTYVGLRLLRVLRLARVFKFLRIFKNIKSLRVLATTVRESLLDFFIMITILTLLGFIFGAAAYYAENSSNGQAYDSIFKGTYWGIITITSVGYGDIVPITPVGRIISALCALFGAATIGMLVSVLVDRYQRVYARKLYIKQEEIDFNDYSDDEHDDHGLNESGRSSRRRRSSSKIEDPDARAKENPTVPIIETPDSPSDTNITPLKHNNSGLHFIIGYVDNPNETTSQNLIEKINAVVEDRQASGNHISLNIISDNEYPQSTSFDNVEFELVDENNEEEDLTEIDKDSIKKGNVLKTFQRPLSPNDELPIKNLQKNP